MERCYLHLRWYFYYAHNLLKALSLRARILDQGKLIIRKMLCLLCEHVSRCAMASPPTYSRQIIFLVKNTFLGNASPSKNMAEKSPHKIKTER